MLNTTAVNKAVSEDVRQIPMLFSTSYLYLFEPGSQLYRIVEALEREGRLSTLDLNRVSGSLAPSTKISQIKARGVPVRRTEEKRGDRVIHFYEIVRG